MPDTPVPKESPVNDETLAAIGTVLNSLTQFAYGPIDRATTPWQGTVTLTPAQYEALRGWFDTPEHETPA